MKMCTHCGREKPATTEYFAERKDKHSRSGLTSWCRDCLRARAREKQAERRSDPIEREKLLEEKRRYNESVKGRNRKRQEILIENHRRRQSHLNVRWDWTVEEWEETCQQWMRTCAYCGVSTDLLEQDHFVPITHPDFTGTHPGNIVPSCRSCNRRKGHLHPREWLSPERFALIVEWLEKRDRR